ncbi:hypothetical protein NM688_g204 [Phlebia brevispora]|uniref:Uncharacterized protein n=1 Tax=Phlebia brevispora TaxID=194682 RepID=A0ACC1TFS0_9APHY|nr:hypothetical protein NM688_g204 [Phlebia brevispora]
MSLSRFFYEPFYSLSDFDRLFDEAFNARTTGAPAGQLARREESSTLQALRPRDEKLSMDIHEDEKSNVVTATFELPGLKKEDVNIDIQNNVLTISGESKQSSERSESGYAVRERRYGKFSRSIPLSEGVKPDEVKANLQDGVLTVKFPKTTPEQAPKKITIA